VSWPSGAGRQRELVRRGQYLGAEPGAPGEAGSASFARRALTRDTPAQLQEIGRAAHWRRATHASLPRPSGPQEGMSVNCGRSKCPRRTRGAGEAPTESGPAVGRGCSGVVRTRAAFGRCQRPKHVGRIGGYPASRGGWTRTKPSGSELPRVRPMSATNKGRYAVPFRSGPRNSEVLKPCRPLWRWGFGVSTLVFRTPRACGAR
jgi:hypothetical protein